MAHNILPRFLIYGGVESIIPFITLGVIRYTGSSPDDAKRVLDNSQGTSGFGWRSRGHPRGHASKPDGGEASVESYSHAGEKTGFMSQEDQDLVVHHALQTRHAQRGMDLLNQGKTRIVIELPVDRLNLRHQLNIGRWSSGALQEQGPLNGITFLLQRPVGEEHDSHDVCNPQVFTCYPLLESIQSSKFSIKSRSN